MLNLFVYKWIHLAGVFLVFLAFGGLLVEQKFKLAKQRWASISHGVGMFLLLLGGFGMLARLGIHWPWPGWIVLKLGIWIVFGFWLVVTRRNWLPPAVSYTVLFGLALAATYFALWKPF